MATASGKTGHDPPISHLDGDKFVAGSDVRTGLQQGLSNLVDRHFASYVRYIRTNRLPLAVNHMAGGALPFTEEELLSSREVAGYHVFSSRRIQRVYQVASGVQSPG